MTEPSAADIDRIVHIETALMHLEHDVEQLHQALVIQQREIDGIRRILERIEATLDRDAGMPSEVRDPLAEKPPHY